jgi:hypothetical protein
VDISFQQGKQASKGGALTRGMQALLGSSISSIVDEVNKRKKTTARRSEQQKQVNKYQQQQETIW